MISYAMRPEALYPPHRRKERAPQEQLDHLLDGYEDWMKFPANYHKPESHPDRVRFMEEIAAARAAVDSLSTSDVQ